MKTLTKTLIALIFLSNYSTLFGFCGFYVAKADAKLFNKTSQVIIVRDGNKTVVTMSNDFEGDVKDFAMVVPVPEVLKRQNIRLANSLIFEQLDAYSGPRLVEYYDDNPCAEYVDEMEDVIYMESMPSQNMIRVAKKNKVTIEAKYQVGEYDILILSAKESSGLQQWLTQNGYKIPETAHKVLPPYIKNNMKFFVVKVNLEKYQQMGNTKLRPIQIAFQSEKFMLPIRLGMANAKGAQDMIIYAFSKNGQVETTNYRTVKIPTNINVPEFIKPEFGNFYKDMFKNECVKQGKNTVFLEYAWDVSLKNYVRCDPCASTPPSYENLREAGVFWLNNSNKLSENVFFTRLHVRYDRAHFPQDLFFQVTPNKNNFQGRYIMQHAIKDNLSCDAAQNYYKTVLKRRKKELKQMASLTGWNISKYNDYLAEIEKKIVVDNNQWIGDDFKNDFSLTPFIDNDNHNDNNNTFKWLAFVLSIILMSMGIHTFSKKVT